MRKAKTRCCVCSGRAGAVRSEGTRDIVHAMEKGLICGLREAYPQLEIIGCQPCISPPNDLCLVPSRQDRLLNILPDKMLVLGPVGKEMMRDFVKDLSVDYSPPFRYRYIFEDEKNHLDPKNILVLFGYELEDAKNMLRTLLRLEGKIDNFDRIYLKIHPGGYFNKERLLREVGKPLPEQFQFIEDRLEDCLKDTCVGICGDTGTAVELALHAIPVIVIGQSQVLTMNYLAGVPEPDLWKLCFLESEVLTGLEKFREMKLNQETMLRKKAHRMRESYFASDQDQHWKNFLFNKCVKESL